MSRNSTEFTRIIRRVLMVGLVAGVACAAVPVAGLAQPTQTQPTATGTATAGTVLQPGPDQRRGAPPAGSQVPFAGTSGSSDGPPMLGGPGSGQGGGGLSGSAKGG